MRNGSGPRFFSKGAYLLFVCYFVQPLKTCEGGKAASPLVNMLTHTHAHTHDLQVCSLAGKGKEAGVIFLEKLQKQFGSWLSLRFFAGVSREDLEGIFFN